MKSLIHTHFSTSVPRTGIPIAQIEVDPIFSTDAISVIDLSADIRENSFFQQDTIVTLDENIKTYFVDKDGFMLTDRFSGEKPLYYKHTLAEPIYSEIDSTSDISVVRSDGTKIDSSLYTFDCGNNSVYHSLAPENIDVYFVVYPRADADGNLIDRQYKELLSAGVSFVSAKHINIGDCGVDPEADNYLLEELDGQPYKWRITLPRSGKYSLRYTNKGLLNLILNKIPMTEPWYVDVNNTVLFADNLTQDVTLRYAINEFNEQTFLPYPPYKLVSDIHVKTVIGGVLELEYENVLVSNKTPIDLKIRDTNNRVIRAITTDTTRAGLSIGGVYWETDAINSVDSAAGRVQINRPLQKGETVLASFYYESDTYTYRGYNFNPLFNSSTLSQKVAILVKPTKGSCINALSHVVIQADDVLVSASDSDINDWIDGTKTYNDLVSDWLFIPTVSESNINNYFLLGIISVATPTSPKFAKTRDARRRGGGIPDNLLDQAMKIMKPAYSNWDLGYYNGPPLPLKGVALIYLPSSLTNTLSETEIRERAMKHVAAGTYLMIRYY